MNVIDVILNRRSVREYSPRPIPDNVMGRCRLALRAAPSACNYQPWRFVMVTDPQTKKELVEKSCSKWHWMLDAPVIVVGCGLAEQAYKKMGGNGNSLEVDVAIALDHLSLAAADDGLGTCWIGAFDEPSAKAVLGVPPNVRIVAMTPLGYPAREGLNHPLDQSRRKSDPEIFSENRYPDTVD